MEYIKLRFEFVSGVSNGFTCTEVDKKDDFDVNNQGSIVLLTPMTPAAHEWVETHLPDDALTFGPSIAIEHRYAEDILEGIVQDGLSLHVF